MIQISNIILSFINQTVFDNISFIINQGDRIGLIGRNGSGKTTFLKSIIDPTILDDGNITIQKNKKIAYMPQEVVLQSNLSVLDETFSGFAELKKMQEELDELEKIIHQNTNEKILNRYIFLQEELSKFSPELLMAKTKKILMGLGFSLKQLDESVNDFSVGWKMRIVLAKLLLQEADFYLFDEPTNHLDLIAKEWFLKFLKDSNFGFLLICHEKYFLDELCKKIVEFEFGKANFFTGNYSEYIKQKEYNLEMLEIAYNQQQKEIKRKQETIERFRASASKAKMAQSMEKQLDKIEQIELPPSTKNVRFNFLPIIQPGKMIIKLENVAQKFDDKLIFQNVSFEVERGQKVALIAPNGVGKSTLFNLIAAILPISKGTISFGHNVTHAIFAQDQNKALNMNLTILENIINLCPKVSEQKIRSFLGAFLFSGKDVTKKVGVLSGGEKNRVGMVSVLLQNTNLLLLDEPTNHLDIPSKEILLKALQEFEGTLLFVSHDRDFINQLATDILELTSKGCNHYKGNYDEYIYYKKEMNINHEPELIKKNEPIEIKKSKNSTNKIKQIEDNIIKVEKQIKLLNDSFATLEYNSEEYKRAIKHLETLNKKLKELEIEWEDISAVE